jgi:hypothetical protein
VIDARRQHVEQLDQLGPHLRVSPQQRARFFEGRRPVHCLVYDRGDQHSQEASVTLGHRIKSGRVGQDEESPIAVDSLEIVDVQEARASNCARTCFAHMSLAVRRLESPSRS